MSKRNENRPGYKKTRVGWIPLNWTIKQFGSLVIKSQYGLSIATNDTGTIPILGMSNINDGKLQLDNMKYVQLSNTEYLEYKILKDDILFNRTNSPALVGKSAIAVENIECVFASYLVRFRIESSSDPSFVTYFLNSNPAINALKRLATPGVSQSNINPTTLRKHFTIPIPPLSVQKKIAQILSKWDKAIEKTRKLIEAKKQLKKGLMQQLLTGRMRFPQFGPPSKNGEMPEAWQYCMLGKCFDERNEYDVNLPLLSITGNRGVIHRGDVERKDTSNIDKSKYKRIVPGDIGYNTMRMWQGNSAMSSLEGIVSPAYTICKPKAGQSSEFYKHLFKYKPIIHLFYRYSQGLVSDTWNLKYHHFAQIKVAVPDYSEQIIIANMLNAVDSEVLVLEKKLSGLEKQKKGLMQKLLTGEIRVQIPN